MSVRTEITGRTLTAYLDGEIDHHTAKNMRETIDISIKDSMPEMLILDFKDVTFMDSSGIGLVMGRYKELSKYKAELQIVNTTPHITKVMKLAGLERLAKIGKVDNYEINK